MVGCLYRLTTKNNINDMQAQVNCCLVNFLFTQVYILIKQKVAKQLGLAYHLVLNL